MSRERRDPRRTKIPWAPIVVVALLAAGPLGAQAYDPVGPQTAVEISTVESGGWEPCFSSDYRSTTGAWLSAILAGCTGEKLLLACAPDAATAFVLLAQGPHDDVLANPGSESDDSHLVNGAQWYFDVGGLGNGGNSWGFAAAGDAVARNPCDYTDDAGEYRLCWHMGENEGGYRCGAAEDLNSETGWNKYVYRYTSALFADDFENEGAPCPWSSIGGVVVDCSQTLTLGFQPDCGAVVLDQGADDLDPDVGEIGFRLQWNELWRERGYRLQVQDGIDFVIEDDYAELAAGSTQSPILHCYGSCAWTFRVLAHVEHAPGHGPEPITGDVVSNECTVNTAIE